MKGAIQTEFPLTLPIGYVDEEGTLQKEGTMRLATAGDEILPLKDPRVQQNPAYLTIILLSRVITKLGSLQSITPQIIESLFAADLAFLQEMYNRINQTGTPTINAKCPKCDHAFEVEMQASGE
jgi:hypothetical protein